jgi:predicted dehydrogenase
MVELARKRNTPIFSASILRFEPAFEQFRNRLPEVGDVNFATFGGYGTHPAGLVHTISATQLMFGAGISTTQVMVTPKQTSVWLDYDQNPRAPKHGVMIHTKVGSRPYTALAANVYGSKTDISTLVLGDLQYAWGTAEIIRKVRHMIETRQSPAELSDMIEAIAVIQACKKSESSGQAVRVAEFLN